MVWDRKGTLCCCCVHDVPSHYISDAMHDVDARHIIYKYVIHNDALYYGLLYCPYTIGDASGTHGSPTYVPTYEYEYEDVDDGEIGHPECAAYQRYGQQVRKQRSSFP